MSPPDGVDVAPGVDVPAGFADAHARWRSAVAGVLAKARPGEELPDEPERLLDTPTLEGPVLRPLYTVADARPEEPLPGHAPFVRGGDALRDPVTGWRVAEEFPTAGQAPAEANTTLLDALNDGVSAIVVRLRPTGSPPSAPSPADLRVLLDGVLLDLVPVVLDAGPSFTAAADVVADLVAALDDERRLGVAVDLGADPLTDAFAGRAAADVEEVVARGAALAGSTALRAITVDAAVAVHDRGADAAWEIAAAVVTGLAYLRRLVGAGTSPAAALGQVSFRFAVDDDQFLSLTKLRAARRVWARVAEVIGAPEAGAARLHAVTSRPMMARRDPWINMLRTTVAAFAAGVGGADTVTVAPFDAALPGGHPGIAPGFARRIARNSQLLLLEESHVGRVADPAGGSWYVEDLTEALAEQAWGHVRALEALGDVTAGDLTEVHAHLAEVCARTRAVRDADVAHRRTAVTGVNEFPWLAEPPQEPLAPTPTTVGDEKALYRRAAVFEALRDRSDAHLARTGVRPSVLLLPLGPLAEHGARTSFVANLLASGGIEARDPGPLDVDGVAAAVAAHGDAPVVVVCGTDARYRAEASAVVVAARRAGAGRVLLAGGSDADSEADAEADVEADGRPDGHLTATLDVPALLAEVLDRLGA